MVTSKATVGSVPKVAAPYPTAKRAKFSGTNRATTTLAGFAKGVKAATFEDQPEVMSFKKQPSYPVASLPGKPVRTGGGN